ncbi:hypothetical protein KY359_05575 [Candidatus Woesearchaeota archaeon]|nr:hypothetical protein [Candidatus Woesearchaeota archaeon]
MKHEKAALKELKRVNRKIDSISASVQGNGGSTYAGYFLVFIFIAAIAAGLFFLGPSFTGFVTFSESVVRTEPDRFSIAESGSVNVQTELDTINSIMLTGTVFGNGRAAVFLQGPELKYLAYYFEGDASGGVRFEDMCYDTCHLEGLGNENTLVFELDNMWIDIESIKYMYSRIIDFDLEPRTFAIDYNKDPVKIVELKLTNSQLADYSVLLYIDGPLSSSFSWQGSLVHMTPDQPEKVIPVTVKLPSNLQKGTYTHKITARYVPPDTHDFVGESPVAESFITVYNE